MLPPTPSHTHWGWHQYRSLSQSTLTPPAPPHPVPPPTQDGDRHPLRKCYQILQAAWIRGGFFLYISISCSIISCGWLLNGPSAEVQEDGWTRALLSIASLCGWLTLILEGFMPHSDLSIFVNVVIKVLKTDVFQFLAMFVPLLIGFTTAINALLYIYPAWATRWSSWWLVCEHLLLLSFIQEPPEIYLDSSSPSSLSSLLGSFTEPHSSSAVVPLVLFYVLYVTYLILSVVLLINLLIAMMTKRYEDSKQKAEIITRVAFGRVILRFERFLEQIESLAAHSCCCLRRSRLASASNSASDPEKAGAGTPASLKYESFRSHKRAVKGLAASWSGRNETDVFEDDDDEQQPLTRRELKEELSSALKKLHHAKPQKDVTKLMAVEVKSHIDSARQAPDDSKKESELDKAAGVANVLAQASAEAPSPSKAVAAEIDAFTRLRRLAAGYGAVERSRRVRGAAAKLPPARLAMHGRFTSHVSWSRPQPFVTYASPEYNPNAGLRTRVAPFRDRPRSAAPEAAAPLTKQDVRAFVADVFTEQDAQEMSSAALETLATVLDEAAFDLDKVDGFHARFMAWLGQGSAERVRFEATEEQEAGLPSAGGRDRAPSVTAFKTNAWVSFPVAMRRRFSAPKPINTSPHYTSTAEDDAVLDQRIGSITSAEV